jgi:hypothetical protein
MTHFSKASSADIPCEATTGETARLLQVHPQTLYAMRDRREIQVRRTASGRHFWSVRDYLERAEAQGV